MGGVTDEAALHRLGLFEPAEHPVHRRGQGTEFIVTGVHATGKVRSPDAVDLPAQPLHRTQGTTGDDPHHQADEEHHQWHGHDQQRRRRRDGVVDMLHRACDGQGSGVRVLRRGEPGLVVDGDGRGVLPVGAGQFRSVPVVDDLRAVPGLQPDEQIIVDPGDHRLRPVGGRLKLRFQGVQVLVHGFGDRVGEYPAEHRHRDDRGDNEDDGDEECRSGGDAGTDRAHRTDSSEKPAHVSLRSGRVGSRRHGRFRSRHDRKAGRPWPADGRCRPRRYWCPRRRSRPRRWRAPPVW